MLKFLSKAKGFLNRNKVAVAVSAVSSALSVVFMSAFAADSTSIDSAQISSTLTSGFQSCVNDIITYAVAIVPIALSAFGVTLAITKCVQFFKKMTGR